jgi:RNA polymerase sigma-70 factor (ECF subfamily)
MEREPERTQTRGDPSKEERLEALFDSCYPRLARYAYARIGNHTDAEDIASEVFMRALESLDSYQERGLPMEAWLFRIAHNLVVDRFRRATRFERVDEPVEGLPDLPDPAHIAEERLMMADVRTAMDRLTPEQRDVVALRFFAGLASKEVAAALNKSDGAVREMQRAALEKLRGLLSP